VTTAASYDLYGSRTLTLDELRVAVEGVLDVDFERHESMYLGGDYFLGEDAGAEEKFQIQSNDLSAFEEGDLAEPEFAAHRTLLRVDRSARGDELRERLTAIVGLEFLKRSTL
jgi:hypothetical protein